MAPATPVRCGDASQLFLQSVKAERQCVFADPHLCGVARPLAFAPFGLRRTRHCPEVQSTRDMFVKKCDCAQWEFSGSRHTFGQIKSPLSVFSDPGPAEDDTERDIPASMLQPCLDDMFHMQQRVRSDREKQLMTLLALPGTSAHARTQRDISSQSWKKKN